MIPPVDEGLQIERTLLAWRRTCLVIAVASAFALRMTIDQFGLGAIGLCAVGVAAAAAAYLASAHRYRRAHRELSAAQVLSSDGQPLGLLSLAMTVLSVGCGVFVLNREGML